MKAAQSPQNIDIPEFIIKSTLGCSIVVILILTPYFFINVFKGEFYLSLGIGLILTSCLVNAFFCYRGEYHLGLNTYVVSPIAAMTVIFAIYHLGEAASYWAFPTTLSFYFVLPERRGSFYNFLTSSIVVLLMWQIAEPEMAGRFTAALVGTSLFVFLSMRQIYRLHSQLKEQAVHDHLTGLLNRTTLAEVLNHAIAHKQRAEIDMTLISFDIDHFKHINDNHGHAIGDNVLRDLSTLLKDRVRDSDKVFRVGGEEFLLLAYNTDEKQGHQMAENLRKYIAEQLVISERPITISLGVSELAHHMTDQTWLKDADDKLYQAKNKGRNQVFV